MKKVLRFLFGTTIIVGLMVCVVILKLSSERSLSAQPTLSQQPGPRVVENVPYAVKVNVKGLGSRGSGALVRNDLVLTSYSIVRKRKNGEEIAVEFADGFKCSATIVKTDPVIGLALLRIKPVLYPNAAPSILKASKKDTVTIYGFTAGGISAAVIGKVVGYRMIHRDRSLDTFLVNNKSLPGMVGGPVIDESGDMVGILHGSWVYSNCTDLVTIKKFLSDVN